MSRSPASTSPVRLHVVSGKGGTGKTTVAAALALALASGGRRVLLCEVEGRQGIASVFDVAPLPYDEREIAVGPGGGEVFGLAIDPEAALLEYLDLFYRLGRAGKALDRFGVIDFATTIAPGLRDVLLTGKVYEATGRRKADKTTPVYDAVVLDAPPTGRIGRFLNVNTEVAGVAKVGPIRNQADSIMRLLKSEQTRVHLVSTLEEMPVQEAVDAVEELERIGLRVGALIVNLVREAQLSPADLKAAAAGTLDAGEIAVALKSVGVKADDSLLDGLMKVAKEHAERVALESSQRARLREVGKPVVELPYEIDGIDVGTLYGMAETLVESGAV